MMKSTTFCLALLAALTISNSAQGQLLKNLFGGNDTNQSKPLGNEPSALGSLNESNGQQKFRLPTLPSLFKQQDSQSDVLGRGDLGELSNLVPTPQLPSFNSPNLLNQFNSKSKQMIDRTTVWARDKQQQLKENTFGRLSGSNPLGFLSSATAPEAQESRVRTAADAVTNSSLAQPSTTPPKKPDYFAPPKVTQPAQPPIRTASSPDGQPAMRF